MKTAFLSTLILALSTKAGFAQQPALFSATREVRGRFWVKRYGPSRRCA